VNNKTIKKKENNPFTKNNKPGTVMHTCNEAEGAVQSQPGLQ
jgi:hypothetical protein